MRAVVQRVSQASVEVDGETVGRIGDGLLVLVGTARGDAAEDARTLAEKVVNLRIFEDLQGKMNLSVLDVSGGVLAVSQFTLLGDCRKGRRPSFVEAMEPREAERLFEGFVERVSELGPEVETGRFGAMMEVNLTNNGPVTLMLDSRKAF